MLLSTLTAPHPGGGAGQAGTRALAGPQPRGQAGADAAVAGGGDDRQDQEGGGRGARGELGLVRRSSILTSDWLSSRARSCR